MKYSIKMIPVAEVEVPYPEVYWMESFREWTKICFYVGIIRNAGNIILINTGFPNDIAGIVKGWKDYLGERAILRRPDNKKTLRLLKNEGIDPDKVTHVIVTPIQLYATGNLHLFKNAKICFSRKGWMEDIINPSYPHHVPRQGCISDKHLSWLLNENKANLALMDNIDEIVPGITCKWVGVHHRSSILVQVSTSAGLVGISDCAFHYSNVEDGRPLGIAESIIEAHAAYSYIRTKIDIFVPLYDPLLMQRHEDGIIA